MPFINQMTKKIAIQKHICTKNVQDDIQNNKNNETN